jgi:HPt (histidine-containing phosphotransfer) domain-containing protein
MHKLRGSVGMLGAKKIQQLAAEAEAACGTGDVARAATLAASLDMLLRERVKTQCPS